MGAKVQNPRKQFQFNIIIAGLNPFLVQEVKSPDIEYDQVEHGDTNFDVKTGGRKKISNLQLQGIEESNSVSRFFDNWGRQVADTSSGGGAIPAVYKRVVIIEDLANDGITVTDRRIYTGAWPCKINGKDYNRRGSENIVRSIELSVDEDI